MPTPGSNEHLVPIKTDRGFSHLPAISSTYGGEARVCESSSASGPHIWLFTECPEDLNNKGGKIIEVAIHLTDEDAYKLAEQLIQLYHTHYQKR